MFDDMIWIAFEVELGAVVNAFSRRIDSSCDTSQTWQCTDATLKTFNSAAVPRDQMIFPCYRGNHSLLEWVYTYIVCLLSKKFSSFGADFIQRSRFISNQNQLIKSLDDFLVVRLRICERCRVEKYFPNICETNFQFLQQKILSGDVLGGSKKIPKCPTWKIMLKTLSYFVHFQPTFTRGEQCWWGRFMCVREFLVGVPYIVQAFKPTFSKFQTNVLQLFGINAKKDFMLFCPTWLFYSAIDHSQ